MDAINNCQGSDFISCGKALTDVASHDKETCNETPEVLVGINKDVIDRMSHFTVKWP